MREPFRIGDENSGHVECHIAVADDHRALTSEFDCGIGTVRVPVDPGNQVRCASGASHADAIDVEAAITRCTDGIDNSVVAF